MPPAWSAGNSFGRRRSVGRRVRWYGYDGQRYRRSCTTRKEAERLTEEKQLDVRVGQGDEPRQVTLKEFGEMYLRIRTDLAERNREEHDGRIRFLPEQLSAQ